MKRKIDKGDKRELRPFYKEIEEVDTAAIETEREKFAEKITNS